MVRVWVVCSRFAISYSGSCHISLAHILLFLMTLMQSISHASRSGCRVPFRFGSSLIAAHNNGVGRDDLPRYSLFLVSGARVRPIRPWRSDGSVMWRFKAFRNMHICCPFWSAPWKAARRVQAILSSGQTQSFTMMGLTRRISEPETLCTAIYSEESQTGG
jgi:hypothetical protein